MQGCPAAALMFTIAFNVPLILIDSIVCKLITRTGGPRPGGTTSFDYYAALFDDVAIILPDIKHLVPVQKLFATYHHATGIGLNLAKCVVIPARPAPADRDPDLTPTLQMIERRLQSLLPRNWNQVRVRTSAPYLGFHVGMRVAPLLWRKAGLRWRARADDLAAAQRAVSLTVAQYNTRALPTLSFIAQLYPFPKELVLLQRRVHGRLYHHPANALEQSAYLHLDRLGAQRIQPASALCGAARLRASLITSSASVLTRCRFLIRQIGAISERVAFGSLNAEWNHHLKSVEVNWDKPALADLMHNSRTEAERIRHLLENPDGGTVKQISDRALQANFAKHLMGLQFNVNIFCI